MKTFSELVECLGCKAGVFFFYFRRTESWSELKKDSKGGVDIKGLGIGHQSGASLYESLLSTSQECV